MATAPSAFFGQFVSGAELSHILAAPVPFDFDNTFDSGVGTTDHFTGTPQDDIFRIQLGDGDTATGGAGYDAVVATPDGAETPLVLDSNTESGILAGTNDGSVIGNALDNVLIGNSGSNTLVGGAGSDTLIANAGDDNLVGGGGDDTLYGDAGNDLLTGNLGNDHLFGGVGDDVLFGGAGSDYLSGDAGNDLLVGGPGNDSILGGPGNDTIFGGQGVDTLTGGAGRDFFHFQPADHGGIDKITDFHKGQDKIDLTDFHTTFQKLHMQDQGNGVIITVGKGASSVSFKLIGFHKKNIDGSFFQF